MSDKKLDGILHKLEKIESEQVRHADLVTQLIGIVKLTNEKVSDMHNHFINAKKEQEQSNKKVIDELHTHAYSIEILNRKQFKIETDLEKLKNQS